MIKVANLKIAFRPLKYSILRQFIKEIQQKKKKKKKGKKEQVLKTDIC